MKNREIKIALFNIGEQTNTGRVYPKEVVEKAIEKFNEKERFVTIQPNVKPFLSDVIGKAKLALEGDTVQADMEIFRIEKSEKIWEFLQAGRARFEPMGFGTTVNNVVQDDYEIRHIALVGVEDE